VQQRRKAHDRHGHVRHDAERAAEGRHDACPPAARQPRREREQHARPGRYDDDQRGDQKIDAHMQ
jgi:hypothetical protein